MPHPNRQPRKRPVAIAYRRQRPRFWYEQYEHNKAPRKAWDQRLTEWIAASAATSKDRQ